VNFVDFSGITNLILAVQYGLPGTVQCLLDAGANPNIPDEVSFYWYPLLMLSFVMIYFMHQLCYR
jgi:ankyrin repeat protein